MNQAIRKLSGLLVLPVLLAALLLMPVRVQAAGYECYADLPVSVVINGDYEEQFTVVLTPGDETTPMPTQSALQIAGGATGVFEDLHFTEPGDYYYTVQQTPGSTEHMTYDDTQYTVTIRVTNSDDGGLQSEVWAVADGAAEKTYQLRFLNTYAPPEEEGSTPTPTPAPTADPEPAATATPAAGLLGFIPQTGDSLPLTLLVVLVIAAVVAAVVLIALKKRNNNKNDNK